MALIITKAGLAALANAEQTGTKTMATHIAVGDGNGFSPEFTSEAPGLVNEVWRGALQKIELQADGQTVEFQAHIPLTVGGWWVREVALYADDILLAIGSHSPLWKPEPDDPGNVLEVGIYAQVTFGNASTLELVVDPTKVLASQEHVEEKIAEHDADANAHEALRSLLGGHADRTDNPHAVTAEQVGAAPVAHSHGLPAVVAADSTLDAAVAEASVHITGDTAADIDLSARNRFVRQLAADYELPVLTPPHEGEWVIHIYPNGHTLTLAAGWAAMVSGMLDSSADLIRLNLLHDSIATILVVQNLALGA